MPPDDVEALPDQSLDPAALYGSTYYADYTPEAGIPYERNAHWLSFFGGIADEIVSRFAPRSTLDAGCALGFLVEALRDRGVEAYGVDVSEFAISQVAPSIRDYVRAASLVEPLPRRYDLITCIEVIEHVPRPQIGQVLDNLCASTDVLLLSSTPHDWDESTHVSIRPPEDWVADLARRGFFQDHDADVGFVAPWTMLFRRSTPTPAEVARAAARAHWQLLQETLALRTSALRSAQARQLAEARGTTDFVQFENLLHARDEAAVLEVQLGEALAALRVADAELERYREAVEELALIKRSPMMLAYEPYAKGRRRLIASARAFVNRLR